MNQHSSAYNETCAQIFPDAGAPWGSLFRIQNSSSRSQKMGRESPAPQQKESCPWITHSSKVPPTHNPPPTPPLRLNQLLPLIRSPSASFETARDIPGQLDGIRTFGKKSLGIKGVRSLHFAIRWKLASFNSCKAEIWAHLLLRLKPAGASSEGCWLAGYCGSFSPDANC